MQSSQPKEEFKSFQATSLYCPRCKEAVPIREKLLLLLPEGQLFEYLCSFCATSVGTRKETSKKEVKILPPESPI